MVLYVILCWVSRLLDMDQSEAQPVWHDCDQSYLLKYVL